MQSVACSLRRLSQCRQSRKFRETCPQQSVNNEKTRLDAALANGIFTLVIVIDAASIRDGLWRRRLNRLALDQQGVGQLGANLVFRMSLALCPLVRKAKRPT